MLIKLPVYGMQIKTDGKGLGIIQSDIGREVCPGCSIRECYFDCDDSQMDDLESEDHARDRLRCNAALDGIESFVVAAVCAGVDVQTPAFYEAIETAVEAIGNNF